MPLPLIPVAILLVASGGGGVAAGADGARRMVAARSRCDRAAKRYELALAETQAARSRVDGCARDYGTLQLRVQRDTIGEFAAWLEANERRVRRLEGAIVEGVEVERIDLPELKAQSIGAQGLLNGSMGAALLGLAARQVALSGVRTAAVASTGTAISTLSGAAANSASLAWLGGGTVAAGGGGVTAGASVLTGVGIAPALLLSGLALNAEGQRALTHARRVEADATTQIADLKTQRELLGRLEVRISELRGVLLQLDRRARASLAELSARDFDPVMHVAAFMRTVQLIQGLREVISTPVLASDGNPSDASRQLLIRYAPTFTPTATEDDR